MVIVVQQANKWNPQVGGYGAVAYWALPPSVTSPPQPRLCSRVGRTGPAPDWPVTACRAGLHRTGYRYETRTGSPNREPVRSPPLSPSAVQGTGLSGALVGSGDCARRPGTRTENRTESRPEARFTVRGPVRVTFRGPNRFPLRRSARDWVVTPGPAGDRVVALGPAGVLHPEDRGGSKAESRTGARIIAGGALRSGPGASWAGARGGLARSVLRAV